MTKIKKLKLCDWSLLATLVLMFVSAVQLEATGCRDFSWTIVHIILGVAFITLIIWHIFLHFRWRNWWMKLFPSARPLMRWLTIFSLLLAVSSVIVGIHWLASFSHSGIGGFHGKIGFVFVIISFIHIWKHRKFYLGKKRIA